MIFLVQIFLKIFQGCHLLLGLFHNSAATTPTKKLKIPFCSIILPNYLKYPRNFWILSKNGFQGCHNSEMGHRNFGTWSMVRILGSQNHLRKHQCSSKARRWKLMSWHHILFSCQHYVTRRIIFFLFSWQDQSSHSISYLWQLHFVLLILSLSADWSCLSRMQYLVW